MSIYRGMTSKEFFLASLLYDSIEDQNLGAVISLLEEKEADPNLVLPKKGISPFHLIIGSVSEEFALEVTKAILQHKGNPNVRSDEGLTPVHIAAAWGRLELLKLLLNSGGDPEKYDLSNKTPLHYAFEENYLECFELLKSYLPDVADFFTRNDTSDKYRLSLDKVVVHHGKEIGEYEVINDCETNSIIKSEKAIESLQSLPKTNPEEYVQSWCDKHQKLSENIYLKPLSSTGDTPIESDNDYSSFNESDQGLSRPFDLENINFKKFYRKTRKVSRNESSPNSTKKNTPTLRSAKQNASTEIAEKSDIIASCATALTNEFSKFSVYSKESGIMTLPSSARKSDFEIKKEDAKMVSVIPKDTSSDYMTCSYNSETNIMEKNVFEFTENLSQNQVLLDVNKSIELPKKEVIDLEKSGSTELSFVSVSEVYKYVDKDEGVVLYERRFLKTPSIDTRSSLHSDSLRSRLSSLPATVDYDTDTLRKELTVQGFVPGPITITTKKVYLKKLRQLKRQALPQASTVKLVKKVYSVELEKTLRDITWCSDLSPYKSLEDVLTKQFDNPDPSRKWREGVNKTSFTYLLLDPRVTNNLPCRADTLQPNQIWETFLSAIFYVGKGKRNRPYAHLYDAVSLWNQAKLKTENNKLQHILDIWKEDRGVVCLHIFQNTIPVEAYTREAAMITALKIDNIDNIKLGDFYGIAASWPQKQKKMLGVFLLYKAMKIFLNEGERQLSPSDIA